MAIDFRSVRPTERITRVIDENVAVKRLGNRPPLARAEFDRGPAAANTRMDRMMLVLDPDATQRAALEALLAAQQDPQSPEYHQWLTPESFGERFGVAQRDLDRVTEWLVSHGFQVEPAPASRLNLVFSGTASQVQEAFHVEVHRYEVNGEAHYSNAGDPEIPAALADVVSGVAALHDFQARPMHSSVRPAAGAPVPEFNSSGAHYLAPGDFATIYDVAGLYSQSIDGSGQSIAVAGRTNLNLADVRAFRSQFGLPANDPTVVLNGPDPGIVSSGEQTEATLDVEWAGAVAKKAAIQFVVSASTNSSDGVALSSQYIVNHNLAPAISLSFGLCEATLGAAGNQFWSTLWQQAAAQGMTVLVAAGDNGAAGCDNPSSSPATGGAAVNGLCSSPSSTCVGGTQFSDTANPNAYWSASNGNTGASALSYIPEASWNESGLFHGGSGLWAGSGGASQVYTKPSWQTGPGVPADGHRDVPDVSLTSAGHDGYLIAMNGQFWVVAGTSAATPSLAGLIALAGQKSAGRLGNANPALYALAAKQANAGAAVFHDVTAGSNSVPGVAGFNAGPGYDLATGLGSVDATLLVNHWGDVTVPTPALKLSESAQAVSVTQGASGSLTLNVTVSGGFNAAVALSAGTLPSGLTATFSPASLVAPGSGASTLKLTAAASAAAGTYSLTITATGGGLTQSGPLAVTIAPNCTYSINPTTANATASAGSYSFAVTATSGCSWTASTTSSWITLASGSTGKGNGTVNYSVAANSATASRTGTIGVAGLNLTVSQAAASAPFSLGAASASFPAAGGNGSVAITAPSSSAAWTASSNASWITITGAASGSGSKTLTYAVAANSTTSSRSGALTIAGVTFTVSQAAAAANCSYKLSLGAVTSSTKGFIGSASITTTAGCQWTATSNAAWLTVTSGASGSGSGTMSYLAAPNSTASSRTGAITVAGYQISLTEAAGH